MTDQENRTQQAPPPWAAGTANRQHERNPELTEDPTLLAMNAAYAAAGRRGGFYELADAAAVDPEIATAALDSNEFKCFYG